MTDEKVDSIVVDFVTEGNINFLCLTETWCNYDSIESVHFPNYYLASSFCRSNGKGGGNGLWCSYDVVSESINLNRFCVENVFEISGISYKLKNSSCILLVCYRPPGFNQFSEFCERLSDLLHFIFRPNLKLSLVGDFNIDPVRDSKYYSVLCNILAGVNVINYVNEPTRNQYQLDHVFCNFNVNIRAQKQEYSDHKTILFHLDLDVTNKQGVHEKRDFSEINIKNFCDDINQETWNNIYKEPDFQLSFRAFYDSFSYHFHKHFPLKKYYINQGPNWVTNEIKKSSKNLKTLFYMKKQNPLLDEYYRQAKRDHLLVVKITKKAFYQKKFNRSDNTSRCVWNIVKELNNKQCGKKTEWSLNIEGQTNKDKQIISQYFNNFFLAAPTKIIKNIPISNRRIENNYYNTKSFFLSKLSAKEIYDLIQKKLKPKFSTSFDDIPSFLIKMCLDKIIEPLCYLVNKSFENGEFPDMLKVNKVVPVYKKGEKNDVNNYRPVSLTSPFSKIFEYCFLYQLEIFLEKYKIISNTQFGFRPNMSTKDALDFVINEIVKHMENGQCPVGVFCDLSRAFDCVDHDLLLEKFEKIGIRGIPLKWSESFLRDRKQYVCVDNISSGSVIVNLGVPQGTVLGPIFFIIFFDTINNDISQCADKYRLPKFADDSVFVTSDTNTICLEIKVNNILANLSNWYSNNSLFLNSEKTNYIRFHHPQNKNKNLAIDIRVNKDAIRSVESVNLLGIRIDQFLNWKDQCSKIISILHKNCYLFRNLKYVLTQAQLKCIYCGKVESILRYGICFWGTAPAAQDVFIAQKKLIRCIVGVPQTHSCREIFKSRGIFTFYDLLIYEMAVYFFNNKNKYNRQFDVHQRNTRNQTSYVIPYRNSNLGMMLPNTLSIRIFNNLPPEVQNSDTEYAFKRRIKKFLHSKTFYSLDEYFI